MEPRSIVRGNLPERLPVRWAKALAGLALLVLALAVLGAVVEEGWARVAYAVAFGAMGFANLAWAVGSLLPPGPRSRALLAVVSPLSAVMMVALAASLGFQFGWWG